MMNQTSSDFVLQRCIFQFCRSFQEAEKEHEVAESLHLSDTFAIEERTAGVCGKETSAG